MKEKLGSCCEKERELILRSQKTFVAISILNRVPEFENELWSQVATGSNTGVIWANTLNILELRFSPESSKMMLPS